MKCPQYERLATLLYDGELDGPLRREVRSHVASCVVCTRWIASIDQVQEVMLQEIDSQVDRIDFSNFWEQLEKKLLTPPLPWSVRLQLWWEKWWVAQPLRVPIGAAAVTMLLVTFLFLFHPSLLSFFTSPRPEPPLLVANNQAQIESLSATTTVALWNEPTSNAPVIWIEDDREGAVP